MLRSAGCRGSLGVCLLALAFTSGSPVVDVCEAEPFEPLLRTFRRQAALHSRRKVLFVFQEDSRDASGKAAPEELQALRRQLLEVCHDEKVAPLPPDQEDDLPECTLSASPDPEDWKTMIKSSRTNGVILVIWKRSESALAVRVSIVGEHKLQWSGRSLLRRKPSADATQVAGKNAGSGKNKKQAGKSQPFAKTQWPGTTAAWFPPATGNPALGLALLTMGQGNSQGTTVVPALVVAGAGATAPAPTPTTELNAKILEFAESHVGQQVGGGQCYEIAVEALAYAGAEPATGNNDWGQEVSLTELLPGDILQFYEAVLVSPTLGTWHLGEPGHTAIVGEVNGLVVTVYHQNVNGARVVRKDLLDLSGLVSGKVLGYRAVTR